MYSAEGQSVGHNLVLDSNGSMVYHPGDVIAILPENNERLVQATMRSLHVESSEKVPIRSQSWIKALLDRGFKEHCQMEHGTVMIPVTEFLRYASLQARNSQLALLLVECTIQLLFCARIFRTDMYTKCV